jgi:hypothetical protein
MQRYLIIIVINIVLCINSFAQLAIKNSSGAILMKVIETQNGRVGIAMGTNDPTAALDINGDLRIRSVDALAGVTSVSVLVLDDGFVKHRILPESIWDGDDDASYFAGDGITINTSNEISALDISPENEKPVAGEAISVADRTVNVQYDNSTLKINNAGELYAAALPVSAGWTFHEYQIMVLEGACSSADFFKWYDLNDELSGIPQTAKAVYLHIALSNNDPGRYNFMATELEWYENATPSMNDAITNGWFLTATVNDTRPAANAGIVKLSSQGLWIALNRPNATDPLELDFCRVKVMGYFE